MGVRSKFRKRAARVAGLAMAAVLSQAAFSQTQGEAAAAAAPVSQSTAQGTTDGSATQTPARATPASGDKKPKRKSHIVREDRPKAAAAAAGKSSAGASPSPAGAPGLGENASQSADGNGTRPATDNALGTGTATPTATLSNTPSRSKKKAYITKDERVQQSKDTRAELRREKKYNPLVGKDANLPDKALYDKALTEEKKGHFDVARLDLQTLLSTYPDSQYLMRSKLAVANSWFQEGGAAALAQAEQEYGDFITFFPNAPEASEAQMRMGDIYLKQMDVPDRDYSKAIKAETQYRIMLKSYPDAPPSVHKEAEQKLRDVQEVLAQREYDLGQFYALRSNYAAAIARYQTAIDTYPLFSHMDDALIGLGDAYEAEARMIRAQPLPEAAKARLEEEYDGKAAAAYREVALNHAAAPHVEDAKERLQSMNLPLPAPTAEQVAASEALEGSRAQYTMRKRLELLFVRKPDTVTAAQIGAPPLEDATPTVAPAIIKQVQDDFAAAVNPNVKAAATSLAGSGGSAGSGVDSAEAPAAAEAPAGSSAAPTLSDVAPAGGGAGDSSVNTVTEATPASGGGGASIGNGAASLGAEILTPGASNGTAPGTMTGGAISDRATDAAAATGKRDPNYGLGLITPKPADNTPLPAAEAAAPAPDAVNEAAGKALPAAQEKDPNKKKKPKPAFDKYDESSSKHKKKKGVDKINPF